MSSDSGVGARLATALADAGHVVRGSSLDAVGKEAARAVLCVALLDGEPLEALRELIGKLVEGCRVIAVVAGDLAQSIELMQVSERVVAVLQVESFGARGLAELARRAVNGMLFGLQHTMPTGHHQSRIVENDGDKTLCMMRAAELIQTHGGARGHETTIEQALDELLANALYHAPVDVKGQRVFAGISARARTGIRFPQRIDVEYAFDGRLFAVCVRDAYGSLERDRLLATLAKCVRSPYAVDRRIAGAGVGMYLVASTAARLYIHEIANVATEVTVVFDVTEPSAQLAELAILVEPTDVTGQLVPAPRVAAGALRRARRAALASRLAIGAAGVVAAVLLGRAAWARWFPPTTLAIEASPDGVALEIDGSAAGLGSREVDRVANGQIVEVRGKLDGYAPESRVVQIHRGHNRVDLALHALGGTLELDSTPPGATVSVDGNVVGTAPVSLATLPPGKQVNVTFVLPGYTAATITATAPAARAKQRVAQQLARSPDWVRVKFTSEPAGARVVSLDKPDALAHTYTPAEIFVEAGHPQHFELTMPHHATLTIAPFTPARGDDTLERGGKLADAP